ncbi:hypothetical protein E2320_006172, partial [Naja naja]
LLLFIGFPPNSILFYSHSSLPPPFRLCLGPVFLAFALCSLAAGLRLEPGVEILCCRGQKHLWEPLVLV